MIGFPVRSAAVTRPPRPNRCSVYRPRNGLPIPLQPSGTTPSSSPSGPRQLALGEQPLGVLVAGQRRAELAGHGADDRHVEDEVGTEQPEPTLGGMVVVQ